MASKWLRETHSVSCLGGTDRHGPLLLSAQILSIFHKPRKVRVALIIDCCDYLQLTIETC